MVLLTCKEAIEKIVIMNLKDRFGLGSTWLICISLFVYSGLKQMTPRPGITTYALMHLLYLFQSPAWREKTYHKKYTKRAKKISCHSVKQKSFNLWLSRNCHNFFFSPPVKIVVNRLKISHSFTRIPLSPSSLCSNQKGSWTLLEFFFQGLMQAAHFSWMCRGSGGKSVGWLGERKKNHFIELLLHYEKSLH